MTATAQRRKGDRRPHGGLPARLPLRGGEDTGVRRGEVRAAAAELVEAGRAEARAVGAQLRCIHRLWVAAQAGRTAARYQAMARAEADHAARGSVCPDPLGPLGQAEHELLTDVAAEVGPALHLPPGTARRRVQDAVVLAEDLPQVLTALEDGEIGWSQAAVLAEQWRQLIIEAPTWTGLQNTAPPVEAVLRLVAELLAAAPHFTAAQLRATARARRVALVADAAERTRRAARKHRAVWVEPADDGTAYLHALLDAPVAVAAHARLEELVARMGEDVPAPYRDGLGCLPRPDRPEDTEARSAGELRADVLADLLLDGVLPQQPGFPRGVRAQVSIMVPISVLTAEGPCGATGRAGADPAGCGAPVLSGYGPISTQVARQLAAGAGAWHRLLTHPVTGVVLDHDRTVYTVPADLRRLIQLRDGTCRFPGCRRRAQACELDHTIAWADGGPTAEHNLTALCRAHHRIKHRHGTLGRWTLRRIPTEPTDHSPGNPPGTPTEHTAILEWTSPSGLVHRTVPEHQLPASANAPPAEAPPPSCDDDHLPFDPNDDPPPF